MFIPKPKLMKLGALRELQDAMIKTHRSRRVFEEFIYWIRFYAGKLDPTKCKENYSTQDWARFLDKILIVQPKITLYEDYWPVEVYFNFYMSGRRTYHRRHGHRQGASNYGGNEFKNASSDEHSVGPFGNRFGNVTSRSNRRMALSPVPSLGSTNATASSSSKKSHNFDTSSQSVRDQSEIKDHLVVSCFKCGHSATVNPVFRKRLSELVRKTDLLSTLAKLGIFLDRHLDELHRLKHDDLMNFFARVKSDEMTPLDKVHFIKRVAESSNICRSNQQTLDSDFISPPLDIELDAGGSFQKMMKLDDDDFQELMNAMETTTEDYFTIYRPNTEQLWEVATATCVSAKLLNRYKDLWPLKFYLNRRSTALKTRPLYSEVEAEAVFSKVFENQHLPTLMQLPCELHSIIDITPISNTLFIRLHALRLAGLVPALVHVGVCDDAHFAEFCKLSNQERDDLFILGKLKLSQFERFMLRLALSSGN